MSVQVVDDVAEAVAQQLMAHLAALQADGRTPRVALTGGSVAIEAYEQLAPGAVDWQDVELWWGDERFVPAGHEDRNDQQAREAFLDRLGLPAAHVHAMPAHGCDLSMAEAADAYAQTLPVDGFDVVLLGVGPDGHVASLFPGFDQVHETERRVVEVFGSPKPPPERLSLTLPVLCDADEVWFLATGDGKAEAVGRALADDGSLEQTPARGPRGRRTTRWFLDEDAAANVRR